MRFPNGDGTADGSWPDGDGIRPERGFPNGGEVYPDKDDILPDGEP